ncbi:MAG: Trm112 family protein [Gammaproteobacteria bacterium]|nr:Trm112 family protein [Gammaproteobacteria bacterium]
MDMALLEILVCPLCKGKLDYRKPEAELVCRADKLAFPVVDGKPVLLVDSARDLLEDEA